jgi:hypothetical protein
MHSLKMIFWNLFDAADIRCINNTPFQRFQSNTSVPLYLFPKIEEDEEDNHVSASPPSKTRNRLVHDCRVVPVPTTWFLNRFKNIFMFLLKPRERPSTSLHVFEIKHTRG